jgi:uncharacterized membrane protein
VAAVAEALEQQARRQEVRTEVEAVLAERPPGPAPTDGTGSSRAPLGRVGTVLGFAPHGLLSALTLGALFCCSAFDVAAHVAPEPYTYPRSSYWLLVLALVTSVASVGTGIADHWRLDPDGPRAAESRRHQVVAYVALGLSVVSFVLRRQTDFVDEVPVGVVALSLLALVAMVVSWAQGARLVHAARVPSARKEADEAPAVEDEQAQQAAASDRHAD